MFDTLLLWFQSLYDSVWDGVTTAWSNGWAFIGKGWRWWLVVVGLVTYAFTGWKWGLDLAVSSLSGIGILSAMPALTDSHIIQWLKNADTVFPLHEAFRMIISLFTVALQIGVIKSVRGVIGMLAGASTMGGGGLPGGDPP